MTESVGVQVYKKIVNIEDLPVDVRNVVQSYVELQNNRYLTLGQRMEIREHLRTDPNDSEKRKQIRETYQISRQCLYHILGEQSTTNDLIRISAGMNGSTMRPRLARVEQDMGLCSWIQDKREMPRFTGISPT
jgi:hypothetical protein